MKVSNILGVLSSVQFGVFSFFSDKTKIGTDTLGNMYFEAPPRKGYAQTRRWVVYDKAIEASMVPPEWHGWLHHQTDNVPDETSFRRAWQKPHLPNMTGTDQAYRPKGHLLNTGKRDHATGDYEAWTPPS